MFEIPRINLIGRNVSAQREIALKVLVAYEDLGAAIRAKELLNRLAVQLGQCFEFDLTVWGFKLFRHTKFKEQAFRDAISSNVIIVAGNGTRRLPVEVRDWIEVSSLHMPESARALIALLRVHDTNHDQLPQVGDYLKRIAETRGLDFFCHVFDDRTGRFDGTASHIEIRLSPPNETQVRTREPRARRHLDKLGRSLGE